MKKTLVNLKNEIETKLNNAERYYNTREYYVDKGNLTKSKMKMIKNLGYKVTEVQSGKAQQYKIEG